MASSLDYIYLHHVYREVNFLADVVAVKGHLVDNAHACSATREVSITVVCWLRLSYMICSVMLCYFPYGISEEYSNSRFL